MILIKGTPGAKKSNIFFESNLKFLTILNYIIIIYYYFLIFKRRSDVQISYP